MYSHWRLHSNRFSYFNLFSLQIQHVHNRTHYFLPYSALHPAFCTHVNGITILLIIPFPTYWVMVDYFFTFIIHIQLNINKLLVFLDWCLPYHSHFFCFQTTNLCHSSLLLNSIIVIDFLSCLHNSICFPIFQVTWWTSFKAYLWTISFMSNSF